jgi:hypothetical protein
LDEYTIKVVKGELGRKSFNNRKVLLSHCVEMFVKTRKEQMKNAAVEAIDNNKVPGVRLGEMEERRETDSCMGALTSKLLLLIG